MADDKKDGFVYLMFTNPNAKPEALDMLGCRRCHNKTFTARVHPEGEFPELQCAACSQSIGRFGWAE